MGDTNHVRNTRFHLVRFRGMNWRIWIALWCIAVPGKQLVVAQDGGLISQEQRIVETIARGEKSVVAIARVLPGDEPENEEFGFRRRWRDPPRSVFIPNEFASGVILAREPDDGSRYVLTPRHVTKGRSDRSANSTVARFQVRLASRHSVPATLYNQDERSDLSILKLDLDDVGLSAEQVPAVTWGQAENLRKGNLVIGLGNPYAVARDGSASASLGIISNLSRKTSEGEGSNHRPEESATIFEYGALLHIDLRLQLGGSGTAFFDLDGKLVGLGTSVAALQGYESTVGFAVPIDSEVRRIVKSLLDGYEVEYGYLGVKPGDVELTGQRDEQGKWLPVTAAQIDRVTPDSPADLGGLQERDCVLSVNGQPVAGSSELMLKVGMLGPDTIAKVEIWREGQGSRQTLDIRLGKWPVYDDSSIIAPNSRYPAWRGLNVDFSTARWRYMPPQRRHNSHIRAVVITKVAKNSPAEKAQLQEGLFITMVDGHPVVTPAEFAEAVKDLDGPIEITLLDGRTVTLHPDNRAEAP